MPATSQRSSRRTIRANSAGCSGTLSGRLRERPGPRQLLVNSRLRIQAAGHGQARPHRQLIRRSASLPDGIASAVEHRGSGLSDQSANGISPNLRTRLPREVAQIPSLLPAATQRGGGLCAPWAWRVRSGLFGGDRGDRRLGDRRRSPARAASRCRPSCVGAADCAARRRPSSRIASRDRSCCRARPGWPYAADEFAVAPLGEIPVPLRRRLRAAVLPLRSGWPLTPIGIARQGDPRTRVSAQQNQTASPTKGERGKRGRMALPFAERLKADARRHDRRRVPK